MIVYFVEYGMNAPEPVESETHPEVDARGRLCPKSTHFETEEAAWDHLIEEAMHSIKAGARRVDRARQELANLESEAASAVIYFTRVSEARVIRMRQKADQA